MSEENAPKLRLKPKLAPDPIPAQLEPMPDPAPVEIPAAEAPKGFRLKPRLLPPTEQGSEFVQPQESVPPLPEPPLDAETPPVFEGGLPPATAEEEKPARKFALKPKSLDEPFAAELPPVIGEGAREQPLLPPDYVDRKDQEIGEIGAVPPPLTARPFPPPPANFPPPPAAGVRPPPPWVRASGSNRGGRLVQIGATVVIVLVVLGGVFFAYQKFNPTAPGANDPAHPAVVESAPTEPAASETAVPGEADLAGASEAQVAPVPVQPAPVVVKAEPVVPPASPAFKHWVEDLRVGGVRAGSTTRVFIGGTAYATGDVVNSQLGIILDSYNAETRRLLFRDKSGAVVEKRN